MLENSPVFKGCLALPASTAVSEKTSAEDEDLLRKAHLPPIAIYYTTDHTSYGISSTAQHSTTGMAQHSAAHHDKAINLTSKQQKQHNNNNNYY